MRLILTILILLSSVEIFTAQTTFTEDAASWNLNIDGSKDGGHGWTDYDNDGDFDILINTSQNSSSHRSFLLRNDGNSFTDVTSLLAPYLKNEVRERCANWADLNSDGYPDFMRNKYSAIEVYIQDPISGKFGDGNGGTTPQIFSSSNVADGFNSEGAGFIDYDADGDYDIVFDNHNFGIDILENDGNGILTHVTAKSDSPTSYDVNDPDSWPKGLVQDATDGDYGSATDIDNDGFVDFAARKQNQVDFFRNVGGTFTDGVNIDQANNNNKGAISFQDYDNDGDFDLFWTENGVNQIHRNDAGTWVPLGAATGIPTSFSTAIDGIACGDVDNDGDIDIFLAGNNRGFLYINQLNDPILGANTGSAMDFVLDPNAYHSGRNGEGCSFIDIDHDGDLDLYININGNDNQLYINNLSGTPSSNYVFLDIKDSRPEMGLPPGQKMMALGATVQVIDCNGNIISGIREINGGSGHGTMDAPRIHFGLPGGASGDYVFRVSYPNVNGVRLQFDYLANPTDLGAYHFVEAEALDLVTNSPTAVDDIICPGQTVTFNPLLDNGNGADYDPTNDPIIITLLDAPAHGTAVLNGDGTVTYTPDVGYVGNDTFQYTINDRPSCTYGGLTDVGTIYVRDTEAPSLSTQNVTVQLNASGNASITNSDVVVSTNDNCFTPTISLSDNTFNCSDLGTNTITVISTDGMGNATPETAVVTVEDNIAPIAPTLSNVTGQCSATVTAPTAPDNCAGAVTGTTSDPLSYNTQGTFTITWTFNDGNGNSSVATQTVIIDDTTRPVDPTLLAVSAQCGATISVPNTTDNCAGIVTGTTSDPLTYNTQGTYTITWSFNDGNGNVRTRNQTVTIDDTQAPVAPSLSTVTEQCSATVTAPNANDNCVGTVTGTTSAPLIYTTQGTFIITWTFNDGNGNSSVATQTIIIDDTQQPANLSIPAVAAQCGTTITAPTTTDNCSGTVTGTTSDPLTYNTQGTFTITWSFNDGNGNVRNRTQTVIIDDTQAPLAPSLSAVIGQCNASVTAPTASDNCAGTVTGTTSEPLTYNSAGSYSINWTFSDGNGNSSSVSQDVTVQDTTNPNAQCQNATVGLDASGNASISVADVNSGSTDNCGIQTMTVSPNTFTSVDLGPNTVLLTVTDVTGNVSTCISTVTVSDSNPPVAVCQDITIALDASGNASIVAADIDGGSTDNGVITSIVASQTSFDCSHLGINSVTLTVTDDAGNSSTCIAMVIVEDNIDPTLIPEDITVLLDGTGSVSITPQDVTASSWNNCGTPIVTVDVSDFDCNDIGSNIVSITGTDQSGNIVNETAIVNVLDSQNPVAVCLDITIGLDEFGNASIIPSDVDGGSTDNCMIVDYIIDVTDFTSANLGTNNVILTVTDQSGNQDECTAIVTIGDNTPPNAICQDITIELDSDGNAVITSADIDGGSTDNGVITSITASQTNFDCAHVGANIVTLTITDAAGNTDSCSATVIVEDNIDPSLTSQNITVYLDANGNVIIMPEDLVDNSLDNCETPSIYITQSDFDCTHLGDNTVEVTSLDVNGNSISENALVTVIDDINPTAICQEISISLTETGDVSITPADVDGGSFDNCSIVDMTIDLEYFDSTNLGENMVVLIVTDQSGNTNECQAIVNIEDTTPPVAVCQDVTISLDVDGNASILAADVDGGSTDNGGIALLTVNQTIFDCSHVGQNIVTLTVEDLDGNTATCEAMVTVVDDISPAVTECIPPKQFYIGEDCQFIMPSFLDEFEFYDNCSDWNSASVIQIPAEGEVFNGTQVINASVTITDEAGFTDLCEFTITLEDNTPPTIECYSNQTYDTDPGNCFATLDFIPPASNDSCGIASVELTQGLVSGSSFPIGETLMEYTVIDVNGNESICSYVITVEDNELPEIVCYQDLVYEANDNCEAVVEDFTTGIVAFDNCSVFMQVTQSPEAGTIFSGETEVLISATDNSGNIQFCEFTITIIDTIDPVISCPDNIVQVNPSVEYELPEYSDNCSADIIIIDGLSSGELFEHGYTTVTYMVEDNSGNSTICSFEVLVNTPPIGTPDTTFVDSWVDDLTIEVIDNDMDPDEDDFSVTSAWTLSDDSDVDINNGTLEYMIYDEEWCGNDTVVYIICDTFGACDTVFSPLSVACYNGIVIPEGFSPNDDGVNDLFEIKGIQHFPNNTVEIFNRWGRKLYSKNGYKNDWDGSTETSMNLGLGLLPEGTYFVVLDLGDSSPPMKSYLYLNR